MTAKGKPRPPVDIVGTKWGMLTVVSYAGWRARGKVHHHYWQVRCDCGNTKEITRSDLTYAVACGCKVGTNVRQTKTRKPIRYRLTPGKYRSIG